MTDTDALVAEAQKWADLHHSNPYQKRGAEWVDLLSKTLKSTTAELRQERERTSILIGPDSDERDALITDPLIQRIQQEQERADEGWSEMRRQDDRATDAEADLARAREVIEKAQAAFVRPKHPQGVALEMALTLATYKQNGADDDE